MTGLRFDTYDWRGSSEQMLRFGPDTGPVVIAALPLFEEANRTRRFLVSILHALAAHGIGSVLPDFPGTGESSVIMSEARLRDQRDAYAALVQRLGSETYAVAVRSGALLDRDAALAGRWHLAPQTGGDLLRDLDRIRIASGAADYAGNILASEMLTELGEAIPADSATRIVRLTTDPRPADIAYPGAPLWRRAEPGEDIGLAQVLAADISQWIASCGR